MERILYKYENNVVRIVIEGTIKSEVVIKLISELSSDKRIDGNFVAVIDSRKARFQTKPSDLTTIYRRIKENSSRFSKLKVAVVQQNPYETALAMILKELLENLAHVSLEVFSTEQAALLWIKQ